MQDRLVEIERVSAELNEHIETMTKLLWVMSATRDQSDLRELRSQARQEHEAINAKARQLDRLFDELKGQQTMRSVLMTVLVLLLGLFLIGTVVAQEGIDAGEGNLLVTNTPVVEETPLPTPVQPVSNDNPNRVGEAVNLITLISGIGIGAVVAGGGVLATVLFIVHKIRTDQTLLAAIEGLTHSYPPEQRIIGQKIGAGLVEAGEILGEVFDDVPVADKSPLALRYRAYDRPSTAGYVGAYEAGGKTIGMRAKDGAFVPIEGLHG